MEVLEIFEGLSLRDAAVASATNDERWYDDNLPYWTVLAGTPWERPSQTAAQAREQRKKTLDRVDRYNRRGSNEPVVLNSIIRSIQYCQPKRRCGDGACPECTRALQRWFVDNVHKATGVFLQNTRELILLSLVPDSSAGIPWAIGGSDFSVNIAKKNEGDPVLQGHFWMLTERPKGDSEKLLNPLINYSGDIK